MTWFRVDDGFADHPKTLRVSLAAIGLWTKAGAWCSKHLTNGEVPQAAVTALGGSSKLARELVSAGLWRMVDGVGYAFHEWGDHQPSKEQVLAKRAATRARVTRHRNGGVEPDEAVGNGVTEHVTNGVGNTTPVPSRPEPAEAERLRLVDPERKITPREARIAFNLAAQTAGQNIVFGEHPHERKWATVAETCNAKRLPSLALKTVCEWFWLAEQGPIRSGRVSAGRALDNFAAGVTADLETAGEWLTAQEAAQ